MNLLCRWMLSLLVLAVVTPLPSVSQTGNVTGSVIDASTREPLPAAVVQIAGTPFGASTDSAGKFALAGLPVGTYTVKASMVGYAPLALADVVVATGKPALLVLALRQTDIGLEAVEVTASYFQKTPDAVVSVQKLSNEEIRRSAGGFEDVVRAISVLPGVAQVQPGRNDLAVRGGAPSENLFIVDNIEIPNINHFGTQGASGGPLSYINLDFVRETSFSTGGFGARYGDRLSSVLSIDLRDGRTDAFGGRGTIAATQFGLDLEGPLGGNGTFVFSARRSYLDLIFKAAGFSFVPEYWDFLGRMNYRLDKSNTLSVLMVGAIDDVAFFNASADDRFDNSRILGTAQHQYVAGASWQHLFGNGFSTVTLGRTFSNYDGIQRDSFLVPIFRNRSKEGETSIRGDVVLRMGSMELSGGILAKMLRFTANLALPGYRTTFGDTLDVRVDDFRETAVKGSAYLQVSHPLPLGAQGTLGGRIDYFSLLPRSTVFSPRASLALPLSPSTSVNLSAGVYRQYPSSIWLVANPDNRSLSAARVHQYIVGLEHLLRPDLRVRVEGFVKEYRDYPASVSRRYLVLANTGGGYGGGEEGFASYGLDRLVSGGSGRSSGVEFLAQKKLSDVPLYGLASFTWSRSRFTALDGVERPGAFDQEWIMSLSAGYRFDERWEANMKFRYASGRPVTPFNPDGSQTVSAYNGSRVRAVHGLDLRVDRRWNFASWNLVVYLDVQNVYNNKATGTIRWNARERRVEEDANGIGLLPSIGVSAEF